MTPERRRELAEKLVHVILTEKFPTVLVETAFLSLEREVREDCAKVCERYASEAEKANVHEKMYAAQGCAAAIRAELKGDGE